MPLKAELNAIKKNYVKLMKLPVKDLLPALKVADVVSDDQREQMNAMKLDKERAEYLLDSVITPALKVDFQELFYNFLQVLENDDNPVVKVVAKDVRSQLGTSTVSQPNPGQPPPGQQPHTPQSYPGQPNSVQPYPPQPYPMQPYPPQPYPMQPYPTQPYPGYQPYAAVMGQPPPGQLYNGPNPLQPYHPQGITQEKILNQGKGGGYIDQASLYDCMRSVCMIRNENKRSKGTGIIGRLRIKSTLEYVLLTCNHVIPTAEDAKSALFYFGYFDETREPAPHKGCSILNTNGAWFWSDPAYHDQEKKMMGYNYTMLKVSKAELDKITFLDKNETMKILGILLNGDVTVRLGDGDNYTLVSQTPSMKVANGRCTEKPSNAVVKYAVTTSKESAGGPVFKEDNNKPRLIAIHNGSVAKVNYGVRLSEILKHWSKGQPTSNKVVSPSQELHPMPLDSSGYKLE